MKGDDMKEILLRCPFCALSSFIDGDISRVRQLKRHLSRYHKLPPWEVSNISHRAELKSMKTIEEKLKWFDEAVGEE
jgi:hypothetical protein